MHLLALLNFTSFVTTAGYGAVFLLCLLQSCCVPTSSELTMGFAGVLAAQGKLSLAAVIVVGVLGEVVGAYIAWAVGRYAGRAVVDRVGRYILLTHRDLDRAEAWYDRHQRFGVFGSRLLPVIRNFVALPAGIAEVPLARFGMLTAAGSLLWDGAWAGLGYGVGAHWHTIAKGIGDLGYVLAVVAVGIIAFGGYHRLRSYQKAVEEEQQRGRHAVPVPAPGTGSRAWDDGPVGTAGSPPDGLGRRPRGVGETGVTGDTGAVRWLGSSSGRPPAPLTPLGRSPGGDRVPEPLAPVGAPAGADRWLGSSSGRPAAHARRADFPNSPIAAWEAAVRHRQDDVEAQIEPLFDESEQRVEANARLTAMLGALLLVLLAIEGISILRITNLLTLHVVVGMILVPVIMLKIGSTTWRFARYYLGSPEYRRKGPPPPLLRLLGPFVVVSSVAVVASGIALLLVPPSSRTELLFVHKATFVLWFIAMVIHVLGHFLDVAELAPKDLYQRTRRQVRGAGARQWAIVSAVCIGILLGVAVAPKVGPWLANLEARTTHKKSGAHALIVPHSPSGSSSPSRSSSSSSAP